MNIINSLLNVLSGAYILYVFHHPVIESTVNYQFTTYVIAILVLAFGLLGLLQEGVLGEHK